MMEVCEKKNMICNYCRRNVEDPVNDNAINKCTEWLDNCSISDLSNVTSSVTDDGSEPENVLAFKSDDGVQISDQVIFSNNYNEVHNLNNIINKSPNNYENIQIYKSRQIHIGDITNINGPVYVNQYIPTLNQHIVINNNNEAPANPNPFFIVPRRTWLAQPPLSTEDISYLEEAAKFVIISHSASEEAYTQSDNNLNVRLIQQFHIECRKWNDISYNFLVGADGSIFEGRGWNVVGAHAYGYNRYSVGICFIGYYSQKLPPSIALRKLKDFIKYGVQKGYIAEDYKLLAHCQCSSTESPGKRLFEELKTWEHWDSSISVNNPSPLVALIQKD